MRGERNTRDYVIQNVLEDGFCLYLEVRSLAWRGLCFEKRRREKAPTRDSRAPAGSLMPDFGRSDGAESPAGPSSDILMGIGCVGRTGSEVDYDLRRGKRALYTISDGGDLIDAGSTE